MTQKTPVLFFDKNDYELLEMVNEVLNRRNMPESISSRSAAHMHPHGIKELTAPRGLRIAFAVVNLLESFEAGTSEERLSNLQALHDEVLFSSSAYFKINTARVLIQIMKELIRHRGNEREQLQLAHDFRMVSTGRPARVREELKKYHLFEMPEEWNQLAFDDRVHDAHTKGRKSPSHLLMDAWIKGIRRLTVVYYNFIDNQAAEELLEAGDLLGIKTTIGIELSSRFRHKYVKCIWELRGFAETQSLLDFLHEKPMQEMMTQGADVSRYQQQYVFDVLEECNTTHLQAVNREYGFDIPRLTIDAFLAFVGSGQPSLLHLARFIHQHTLEPASGHTAAALPEKTGPHPLSSDAALTPETIIRKYLLPCRNPNLSDPRIPGDPADIPALLQLSVQELLAKLHDLHAGANITLSLSNLSVQDTLELLYICRGHITHLEIFNLKDAWHGLTSAATSRNHGFAGEAVDIVNPLKSYKLINDLQKALNTDNVIALKASVRAILWDFETTRLDLVRKTQLHREEREPLDALELEMSEMETRKEELVDILHHLEQFHGFYRKRELKSRIGTGSTGLYTKHYGMGLVVVNTLPPKEQRAARLNVADRKCKQLPLLAHLIYHRYRACSAGGSSGSENGFLHRLYSHFFRKGKERQEWQVASTELTAEPQGNIITLGGVRDRMTIADSEDSGRTKYLNTHLSNALKVITGFIPAFLTFSLTKDWWVLAYFGAFIWFGITGVRNIIQAVLGGGGLRRSPLLPWNSLVSWSRIADSLLYTGFSVPLLDYLVKTVLLDQGLGITTTTNPLMLYSVMALANGLYIFSHNIFRGLPRSAAIGNLFRSLLSIPLAMLFNSGIGVVLQAGGVMQVEIVLQKWAAVISKFASDCIAAIIEGLADRQANTRMRLDDYRSKLHQLFAAFSKLEVLFPDEDVLELLQSPKKLLKTMGKEARDLENIFILNALDCMYFWMYQPRSRRALLKIRRELTNEEWLIFYRSQFILKRYRKISEIIVDGLIGKHFSKALSFYLGRYDTYLSDLQKLSNT